MKLIKLFRGAFILIMVIVPGLYFFSASASNAAAPTVSNLYVPLQGDVTLSNGDVVTFSGQVHVLTRVTFSDAFVPAVQMYVNLIGVEGTSATTGRTYLLVGASNVEWVGTNPGPPDIPDRPSTSASCRLVPARRICHLVRYFRSSSAISFSPRKPVRGIAPERCRQLSI